MTMAGALNPICVMGPTGSGKSALALWIAERFNAEIITVDSAQVYRHLDIGTAKPSVLERQQVTHHLIDVCEPTQPYSVAQFVEDATRLIAEIQARGRLPLLVGGTMLYFRALQTGLAKLPTRNEGIRQRLTQEAAVSGWESLHQRLAQIDPQAALKIHSRDGQRIQRALEVYELTGCTLSSLHAENLRRGGWPHLKIVLAPNAREDLFARLQDRLEAMWRQGFVAEVEGLKQRGDLTLDQPSMRSVGYRQIWQALEGDYGLDEAKRLTLQATMALAKRQYTWLHAEPNAVWVNPLEPGVEERTAQILSAAI